MPAQRGNGMQLGRYFQFSFKNLAFEKCGSTDSLLGVTAPRERAEQDGKSLQPRLASCAGQRLQLFLVYFDLA